jgi:cytochrome oxidase assembly protein ShyY1
MWKFLVSPRALALHAVLVVVAVSFTALAIWQWDRASSRSVDPRTLSQISIDQASPVGTATLPTSSVGRAVNAVGTYDGEKTYVILQPRKSGSVEWSMTPMRLDDGTYIPVVHGRILNLTPGNNVTLAGGRVGVTGRLQASQDLGLEVNTSDVKLTYPKGAVLGGVSTPEIAGLVPGALRPGFIVADNEIPAVGGVAYLSQSDFVVPEGGLRVQNVLYTIQWTFFTFFALFVYIRLMRDAWLQYQIDNDLLEPAFEQWQVPVQRSQPEAVPATEPEKPAQAKEVNVEPEQPKPAPEPPVRRESQQVLTPPAQRTPQRGPKAPPSGTPISAHPALVATQKTPGDM